MIPRQTGAPATQVDAFPFSGGLDLVTPAMTVPSGMLLGCQNYEPDINGGYRRVGTYERFDGRSRPSQLTYYALACTLTATITAGDLVTIAGVTGTYVGLISDGVLLVNPSSVTIAASTSMTVGGSPVGTTAAVPVSTYGDLISEDAQAISDCADQLRTSITALTGSGAVRGVVMYNGIVYAFRDNAGGTAVDMWKSSTSGWTAVALGSELGFDATATFTVTIAVPGVVTLTANNLPNTTAVSLSTTGALPTGLVAGTTYYVVSTAANTFSLAATSGGAAITTSGSQSGTHTLSVLNTVTPADGETVTGGTSGATGTMTRYCMATGAYNNAPAGTMIFTTITGTFSANETLVCSGGGRLFATGAQAAITLTAGGRFRFLITNFGGRATSLRLYGVDGVSRPFEFDGTTFTPLVTGVSGSYPSYIAAIKRYLFLGYGSSVLNSSVGNPYRWVASEGGSEVAVGDTVTGLIALQGEALGIFTRNTTQTLTGSYPGASDWAMTYVGPDTGAVAHTVQSAGHTFALDDRGINNVAASQSYGNFEQATVSRKVQPLIDQIRGLAVDSCVVRQKNIYRIFCSDGSFVSMLPGEVAQFGFGQLGITPNVVWSGEETGGSERIFIGASDGYVYEMDVGQSQDGDDVEAFMRSTYANAQSPRVRKRYRKLVLDMSVTSYAEISLSGELSFGDAETQGIPSASLTGVGAGGFWDITNWNEFFWDSKDVNQPEISLTGTGLNLGIIVYSKNTLDAGHVVQSAVVQYSSRRLAR